MLRALLILAALALPARAEVIDKFSTPWRTVWTGTYWIHYPPRYFVIRRVYEWHDAGWGERYYTFYDVVER